MNYNHNGGACLFLCIGCAGLLIAVFGCFLGAGFAPFGGACFKVDFFAMMMSSNIENTTEYKVCQITLKILSELLPHPLFLH